MFSTTEKLIRKDLIDNFKKNGGNNQEKVLIGDITKLPAQGPASVVTDTAENTSLSQFVIEQRRNYLPNLNCNWVIDIPKGKIIHFWFRYFKLEYYGTDGSLDQGKYNHACRYDYLRVSSESLMTR